MNSKGKAQPERVSLLGPRSELTGDLATTEDLVILGVLEGQHLKSPNITIGPAARVRAEIRAGKIRIEGKVIGDVYAEVSVVIHASAAVYGNIHSPEITIQEGASVNGAVNQEVVADARDVDDDTREQQFLAALSA